MALKTPHKTDIVSFIVAKSDEIGVNCKETGIFVQKLDLILLCGVHKGSFTIFHMKRELRCDQICLWTPRKTGIVCNVAKSDEIGKIATLVSCEISGDFAYGHHKGELDLISVQNTSLF